ncbi:unnamed protein product [Timema podura]|nr:unnamed protein product [Timema podura]
MNKLSASFNTSNSRTPNKQGGVATKKTPSKTPSKTPKKSPDPKAPKATNSEAILLKVARMIPFDVNTDCQIDE